MKTQRMQSDSCYESAIAAMTHMINYLDASSYDAQMTLMDKETRHNIDQVYDQCCKTKKITNADCRCFYANLKALEPVLSTDDGPEYTIVHNDLIKCFRDVKRAGL
jgi:hypothetical protein